MPDCKIDYIYWFAYYNLDSPSVRYRAQYPLDFAQEKLGISSRLVIPGYAPKKIGNFIQAYTSALLFPKQNSLIVIQRVNSNFIYSGLLKLLVLVRKGITVYDLDDADYLEHDPKIIHFFARECNSISAGSPAILSYLKKLNPNVIHTTSPTPDFGIIKTTRNSTFTIGWIGSFGWGHKDSLYKYLIPALKALQFECHLMMIGVTKESDIQELHQFLEGFNNINITIPKNITWRDERSLQNTIAQFDVGVATLLDHPVQLAKSGIKAKQYLNNGVPVICNDLPENNNIVVNGFNGFVCQSVSEFSQRLNQLRNMKDEQYWEYSRNARQSTVHFNHWKYLNDLERLKKSAAQTASRAKLEDHV